tara:strand:- start:519 stop:1583 length:1065 start_codon:yes stop_codon:yes gene_type:complete
MNLSKNKNHIKKVLIDHLSDFKLKELRNKEISFFKNKRILITGASGVIGINLLFFFNKLNTEKNSRIRIDATYNTSIFNFVVNYFKKDKKIKFIKIDLTNKKIKKKEKYDLIFHCAGYGQPAKFLKFKSSVYKLNSNVIIDLKQNLKKNGKFIYLSTTEIYSGNEKKCSEESIGLTDANHPRSSYIDSKRFGESYVVNCINDYIIFRACLIYGPGTKINDERVLNQVILRAIKNKKIDVYGGLNQFRSNLFVTDAIIMMVKSLSQTKNQIFNLNNHTMNTLGEIFFMIAKLVNKKLSNHKSKISGSPKIIKISNYKILKMTKYKISTNIKAGLLKTISWYKFLDLLNKKNNLIN